MILRSVVLIWLGSICFGEDNPYSKIIEEVHSKLEEHEITRIGILVIPIDSTFICESLNEHIFHNLFTRIKAVDNNFTIVERDQLELILEEQKLSLSGLVNDKHISKVGEISGIEALLTVSTDVLWESIILTIRTIDTETAEIISSNQASIPFGITEEEIIRNSPIIIYADGMGIAPMNSQYPMAIKKRMAERAATLDAYRNIHEYLTSASIKYYSIVDGMTLVQDEIVLRSDGYIKNIHVIDSHFSKDGVATVTVLLEISQNELENWLKKD
jgi:hypothetical protein